MAHKGIIQLTDIALDAAARCAKIGQRRKGIIIASRIHLDTSLDVRVERDGSFSFGGSASAPIAAGTTMIEAGVEGSTGRRTVSVTDGKVNIEIDITVRETEDFEEEG